MSEQGACAGAVLTIDLGAIADNYRLLRQRSPQAVCGAAVKADAYGLGADRVATALANAGCRHFFVAHLDEGIQLRRHLPAHAEIYVLHGQSPGAEMECVYHRLTPVLNSTNQIADWRALARRLDRALPAIVQVDSGMSRLGLSGAEVDALLDDPEGLHGVELRYLMSHLACAEAQDHPMNEAQLSAFEAVRARFPACKASLANSSGIFLGPRYHFDLLRPGAALYGIAPVAGAANPMKPVVRLQARVIQTRLIGAGDAVGYGATYRAASTRRLATLSVGYADGWLRAFSNRGIVMAGAASVPILGRVSMDTCTIDVTDADPATVQPGALVDLISPARPIDAVAADAGTIAYEILTSLGRRYHRRYLDAEPPRTTPVERQAAKLPRNVTVSNSTYN
ncbi:alanine racemase [Noviherbaspirillum aerium]|uniref:alanine racemase n=1 Tax=Noviherbaspirillum aerium TaxID=2588497 RepID=UPI00124CCF48|nr:alanine racemase [Noviherbaspirillum aerium]